MIEINLLHLTKTEKRVWVKPTATRKGHYRRVKGGKGKDTPDEIMAKFEAGIVNQDFETAGVFNDDGELIFEKSGEKDKVKFTPTESFKFRGMTLTHNHPIGDSFSPTDLNFARVCEMKAIRVTCRDTGKTFKLSPKNGTHFEYDSWKDNKETGEPGLEFMVYTYDNDVRGDFRSKINNGEMTIAEAEGSHWQEVWKRVSEHDDRIIYEEV